MAPTPQNPERNTLMVIVIYDGDRAVYADYADESQVREIVQIIQKRKFLPH